MRRQHTWLETRPSRPRSVRAPCWCD